MSCADKIVVDIAFIHNAEVPPGSRPSSLHQLGVHPREAVPVLDDHGPDVRIREQAANLSISAVHP